LTSNLDGLAPDQLKFRLNCYGAFDGQDAICVGRCALALSCALAKHQRRAAEAAEEWPAPVPVHRYRHEID
jgi:hypothetical protein